MKKSDTIKLGVAAALLLGAGALILVNSGMFAGGSEPTPQTITDPDMKATADEADEERERILRDPKTITGGA